MQPPCDTTRPQSAPPRGDLDLTSSPTMQGVCNQEIGFSSSAAVRRNPTIGPMTQVAPRQPATARLQEALAALKRAANDRRHLGENTPEHARALELEERLTHTVYELASAIDEERPADR